VVLPAIEVGPPDDPAPLERAVRDLSRYDWVVLTSANGVASLIAAIERARGAGKAAEALARLRVAVVGSATAKRLKDLGVTAALVAKEFRGEALAHDLHAVLPRGSSPRVLLVRAQEAPDALPQGLIEAGTSLDVVAAYKTRPSAEGTREIALRLRGGTLDAVIFSSGSTVDSVCDALGTSAKDLLGDVVVACIGPVTAAAATSRGIRVDVTPHISTFLSAVDALEDHLRGI
jgi:uroporphyrinogen III methyltransferase/synthase